jgi:hypothetical protein
VILRLLAAASGAGVRRADSQGHCEDGVTAEQEWEGLDSVGKVEEHLWCSRER